MKAIPTDDPLFGKGIIRVDGRKLHPMYLYKAKTRAESKYDWDYFELGLDDQGGGRLSPLEQRGLPVREGVSANGARSAAGNVVSGGLGVTPGAR